MNDTQTLVPNPFPKESCRDQQKTSGGCCVYISGSVASSEGHGAALRAVKAPTLPLCPRLEPVLDGQVVSQVAECNGARRMCEARRVLCAEYPVWPFAVFILKR